MKLKKIIQTEKFIWEWWATKLSAKWDVSFETIHEGIMYDFADCIMNLEDIRYCVINKISFTKFSEWYEGVLYNEKKQNLDNYVKYGWVDN